VRRASAAQGALAAGIAGLLALTGCGTAADRIEVRAVTARFYSDLQARRGADACVQLSPALRKAVQQQHSTSRCADAVRRLKATPAAIAAIRVYATSARVDLTAGESVFLSSMRDGWRISALGCRPRRSGPYDCDEQS
jgi:hypothetical protein